MPCFHACPNSKYYSAICSPPGLNNGTSRQKPIVGTVPGLIPMWVARGVKTGCAVLWLSLTAFPSYDFLYLASSAFEPTWTRIGGQRDLTSEKLNDLGSNLGSGKYRSEMFLAISADFGGAQKSATWSRSSSFEGEGADTVCDVTSR
ncbi:hypothetical protein J6590_086499 [Homalodisca vitripennis]|nr:hypothetical protein J6590_086499 [Homalodisca vitripennis]